MRLRRVGSSGLRVSRLALGTAAWGTTVDAETSRDLLAAFVEAGGTLLDTAHSYGMGATESLLGGLLGDVVAREEVTLCTKAGVALAPGSRVVDTSRGALLDQLDTSLRRLSTDHVDLWLVHTWSESAPLEETVGALAHAVSSGRARYVGVSNYGGWQSARASSLLESARVPLVANELQYSLVCRVPEDEVVPAAAALGFGLLPYAPLGGGLLAGGPRSLAQLPSYVRDQLDERALAVTDAVGTAADGLGVSATEVALAWVRERPGVTAPVVGCRTVGQLRAALAGEALELPAEIVSALDEVSD